MKMGIKKKINENAFETFPEKFWFLGIQPTHAVETF